MKRDATHSTVGSRLPLVVRAPSIVLAGLGWSLLVFMAVAAFGAAPAPAASTLPDEFLTQIGGVDGSGAGQLANVKAIATDPTTGDVFMAELRNSRISVFTPWGVFKRAFGWGVADGTSEEAQVCTASCFAGRPGSGAGQLNEPGGLAVAPDGNVYVFEFKNRRVQKFTASGQFLLMFGGEVNKTTKASVCTRADLEGGDVCGAGIAGTGNGEFGIENVIGVDGSYVTVGSDGTVYVGDKGRIQAFEPTGAYKAEIGLPENGNPGALAVDRSSDDLYFAFAQGVNAPEKKPGVYRLNPTTGVVGDVLEVGAPKAVAADAAGHVFAIDDPPGFGSVSSEARVLEFDASGSPIILPTDNFAMPEPAVSNSTFVSALGTNTAGDLYVTFRFPGTPLGTYVRVWGPPPFGLSPPPLRSPTTEDQYAISVGAEKAVVKAAINPHFWGDTEYYVEYGTFDCKNSTCAKTPTPPGLLLGGGTVSTSVATADISLDGLQSNTTYHYRFVAESSGGGPAFGIDPDGDGPVEATSAAGLEGTFTTLALQPPSSCPSNEALRVGASASLPDCRAYEMVSPVEKNGGNIKPLGQISGYPAGLDQSASGGGAFTYSTFKAFGDVVSAPYTSQYIARRDPSAGWLSESISPPREGVAFSTGGLDTEYRAFSPDLCDAWLEHTAEPKLDPLAPTGFTNLYQRDNCGSADPYRVLVQEEPAVGDNFEPDLQGVSANGRCAVFRIAARLAGSTPAPSSKKGIYQVYESCGGGELHLISVQPGGAAVGFSSSVGTAGPELSNGRTSTLGGAISQDGSRIYWSRGLTSEGSPERGPGQLMLRLVDAEETVPVSVGVAQFWTASPDSAKALYTETGKLFRFDLGSKSSSLIASSVLGVMGASADTSRVYFVSTADLAAGATAGKPNLYLDDNGAPLEFIGTLAPIDVGVNFSSVNPVPIKHTARVTPDGDDLVFMSSAALTGYDNTDVNSSQKDQEVFLYSASSDELRCISCPATNARPNGQQLTLPSSGDHWTAAWIPPWEGQLYPPHVLADDGSRTFFHSFDALVERDTNGKQDVYQWEANGTGGCEEPDGCVDLISSGQDPRDSEFVDATPNGDDVFFRTDEDLLPQDHDLVDLYDARVGGGFPISVVPAECEGEACQKPGTPPGASVPASESFSGPGNPSARSQPSCRKGKARVKRKGRTVCVKAKKGQKNQGNSKRKTNAIRRAGR